jgi:hypothetical protein
MEAGTPPPAYYPADNSGPVVLPPPPPTNVINEVLRISPSPSPEPEVARVQPAPVARKKVGRPKNNNPPPSPPTTFELLVQVTMPDRRVRQHGGKTKTEKQEPIKKGPLEIDVNMEWDTLLEKVANLIETKVDSLMANMFEWHWLKPASGAWLPLSDERGFSSMVKQVLTKTEPYIILWMQPPRADIAPPLVSFRLNEQAIY